MPQDQPPEDQGNEQDKKPEIYALEKVGEDWKFTRRKFLASASAAAAAAALSGCNFPTGENEPQSAQASVTPAATDLPTNTSTTAPTDTPRPTSTSTKTKTPSPLPTDTPEPISGVINKAHNMWEGPDTNHPHVAKTVLGEEIWVIGKTDNNAWLHIVDSDGNVGWAFAEFISLDTDIEEVAVAANIPTAPPFVGYAGTVHFAHNMWAGPNTNHPFITKTVLDDNVRVLSRTEDGTFFEIIDSQGNRGWVFSEFITLHDVEKMDIPVGKDIPTPPPAPCGCDGDCGCDGVCGCDGDCGCDGHGTYCTCDTVHYWYPN